MTVPSLDVRELDDPDGVAACVADLIATALADGGTLALSGGSTPLAMYSRLADRALPWPRIEVFQVDERLVGASDPARNWLAIRSRLIDPTGAVGHPMPLDGSSYSPPTRFDVVHLGLGADGHTASLVPGDDVLAVIDEDVAVTGSYQGARRLTLTAAAINRARLIVWQVVGGDKHDALRALRSGDPGVPASLIRRQPGVVVVADHAAVNG